jgi:hypothetical protein
MNAVWTGKFISGSDRKELTINFIGAENEDIQYSVALVCKDEEEVGWYLDTFDLKVETEI